MRKGVGMPSFYTGTVYMGIPSSDQVVSGIPSSDRMVSGSTNLDHLISGIPNVDLRIPESYSKSGIPASIPEGGQH